MRRVWWTAAGLVTPGVALAGEGAGAWSLLAPFAAIALALITRRVLLALGAGAALGALVSAGGNPLDGVVALGRFLAGSFLDLDHFKISLFSALVAAMVGILSVSGAMHGLVDRITGLARGPRGAMTASWLSGLVVFFDDYANCLVVGSAMGPLCDRMRVSRAKLAYIVDSTAAPVATLAIVSTWVAFQVDELSSALIASGETLPAFTLFVQSLPYAFYSWFTLAFVGAVAWSGRDFGPMRAVEADARAGRLAPTEASGIVLGPPLVALIPIAALVAVTFGAMVWTGRAALGAEAASAAWFEVLGAAAAYDAMVIGSTTALVLATLGATTAGRLPAAAVPGAAWSGVRPLLKALLVLYLAWTLGEAVRATGAAEFLAGGLQGRLSPSLVPSLTFVLAAAIGFATGTSFGTMTILIPLAIPLALTLAGDPSDPVVLASTAAVLSGAVLGDHASPISDTTILSSLGAGVDLVTHVRTQLPYAATTGIIALGFGYLPAAMGVSPWPLLLLGTAACFVVIRVFGRLPEDAMVASGAAAREL